MDKSPATEPTRQWSSAHTLLKDPLVAMGLTQGKPRSRVGGGAV